MEENKDTVAKGGLSAASGAGAVFEPSTESEPSAECVRIAGSGLSARGGLCVESGPSAESGLRAGSEQIAGSGLDAWGERSVPGGLDAACEPRGERRLRVADRLHTQDGVGVAGAYAPRCDQCKQPILRLETYIAVGCVTLCDGCYMNMGTGEFLAKIGGELRVME